MFDQAVLVVVCNRIITITELWLWNKLETKTQLFLGGFVQVNIVEIVCPHCAPKKWAHLLWILPCSNSELRLRITLLLQPEWHGRQRMNPPRTLSSPSQSQRNRSLATNLCAIIVQPWSLTLYCQSHMLVEITPSLSRKVKRGQIDRAVWASADALFGQMA